MKMLSSRSIHIKLDSDIISHLLFSTTAFCAVSLVQLKVQSSVELRTVAFSFYVVSKV